MWRDILFWKVRPWCSLHFRGDHAKVRNEGHIGHGHEQQFVHCVDRYETVSV
jgi:hypothetical protein